MLAVTMPSSNVPTCTLKWHHLAVAMSGCKAGCHWDGCQQIWRLLCVTCRASRCSGLSMAIIKYHASVSEGSHQMMEAPLCLVMQIDCAQDCTRCPCCLSCAVHASGHLPKRVGLAAKHEQSAGVTFCSSCPQFGHALIKEPSAEAHAVRLHGLTLLICCMCTPLADQATEDLKLNCSLGDTSMDASSQPPISGACSGM